ncbi:MAG: hypothetical protein CMH60_00400 [Myxococcales bacterium]|nr:hypothetical protein [Myxococcales bacterium]
MMLFRYAIFTVFVTFLLLLAGGLVHATGSSLACPDWPLCFGEAFPTMTGGVLYEHGHRLMASLVGFLTLGLAVWIWRNDQGDRPLRYWALGALILVLFQAGLGGLTVIYRLPLFVSASHLSIAMIFFALLVYIACRICYGPKINQAASYSRGWLVAAMIIVYVQIVLGALVRHTGAGLACNIDIFLCDGVLWPEAGPAMLHMLHRFWGVLCALVVGKAAWDGIKLGAEHKSPRLQLVSLTLVGLVFLQIALGLLTVMTYIAVPPVTAHLGGAALLLVALLSTYLCGPFWLEHSVTEAGEQQHLQTATVGT